MSFELHLNEFILCFYLFQINKDLAASCAKVFPMIGEASVGDKIDEVNNDSSKRKNEYAMIQIKSGIMTELTGNSHSMGWQQTWLLQRSVVSIAVRISQ